jgi:hypothetical protein
MLTLEVQQNYPNQCNTLLSAIGSIDVETSNVIMFSLDHFKMGLSHQLTFQIFSISYGKVIHRTILNEGSSTCIMSLACWKDVGSPSLNQLPNTLKAFDGHDFKLYGLLN